MDNKKTNRLVEAWKKIDEFARCIIGIILCAAIIFACTVHFVDFGTALSTKEENYVALEQVVYDILESKDVTQPLSDKLYYYEVVFNSDGTIDLKLYTSGSEYLKVKLTKDYQIRSFVRRTLVFQIVCSTILIYFILGAIMRVVIILIYRMIRKIFRFIKKPKTENKENESTSEEKSEKAKQ